MRTQYSPKLVYSAIMLVPCTSQQLQPTLKHVSFTIQNKSLTKAFFKKISEHGDHVLSVVGTFSLNEVLFNVAKGFACMETSNDSISAIPFESRTTHEDTCRRPLSVGWGPATIQVTTHPVASINISMDGCTTLGKCSRHLNYKHWTKHR